MQMQMQRSAPAAPQRASFSGASLRVAARAPAVARPAALQVCATLKRSRPPLEAVAEFKKHEKDTGSAELQTALLSRRIDALTIHLKDNDTDYACQLGLRKLLGQRTRLLRYVYDNDKQRYFDLVAKLVRCPTHAHAGQPAQSGVRREPVILRGCARDAGGRQPF